MIAAVGVELPPRWASHPLVVTESAHHAWDASDAWWDDDALLLRLRRLAPSEPPGYGLYGVGDAEAVARLILAAGPLAPVGRTTVPRGTRAALARLTRDVPAPFDRPADGQWDWMMADHTPDPLPGEDRVEELTGPEGLAEASAALAVAHPDGELAVGQARSRWWGWRESPGGGRGALRGVVGADRRVPHAPWVLGSIGTDPAWRRRGVAAATTAVAVRAGLAEAPFVTLGMYADNDAARRTYERVGFVVAQANESSR
ncbi:GNAT family N-acetyltransferase [Xylanimonas ulmi]|uniref:Acetyltransferase (GNAT) family protein n=1 Tax=Xylanimonas ulmi TaxID=228973 RepID=A0A4Q7M159_9MICO|nr:GNAT family N-acetyltransferase [Xylanibacterium ulmi]RZS60951.1 acetyltransferase (GNAT) family protein [Xylanibacterium ulmi]